MFGVSRGPRVDLGAGAFPTVYDDVLEYDLGVGLVHVFVWQNRSFRFA